MKSRCIILALILLTACRTRNEVVKRETQQTVAVQSVAASTLATENERWHEVTIRETVIMEADSTGTMRERLRTTVRETTDGEHGRKIENNIRKLDSAAFYSESNVIYQSKTENAAERKRPRFWMVLFFIILSLAAIGFAVVFLWHKTLKKWI